MQDLVEEAREQNERTIKRNNRWNLIIIVAAFVGFVIYSLVGKNGAAGQGFRFEENGLVIADSAGNETAVNYDQMESVTLVENADYGDPVDGQITGFFIKYMEGTFRSKMFGDYTACCEAKLTKAIWIKTAETSYVINTESDEATVSLYEAMMQRMGN